MVKKRLTVSLISVFLVWVYFSTGMCGTEADAHFQKGVHYVNKGEYQQAIEEFNLALAVDSQYADAYCGIGIAYLNQKKYKEAISALERAVSIDPELVIAYYLLGMAYEEIMDYGGAIAAWNKFLALRPEGRLAERARRHVRRLEELR